MTFGQNQSDIDMTELSEDLQIEACVLYIKAAYDQYKITGRPSVHITPFHTALAMGRRQLVHRVLRATDTTEATGFFLNAIINYKKNADGNIPVYLEYLTLIKNQLSQEDLLMLGWKNRLGRKRNVLNYTICHDGFTKMELASCLACAGGDPDMLEHLVGHGMQLVVKDSKGCNVIHQLVYMGQYKAEMCVIMFTKMMHILDEYKGLMTQLLFTENNQGDCPLEMAARLGVPEMVKAIMNTPTYRHVVNECTFYRHIQYDVTKYESKSAEVYKGILYQLTNMSEEQLIRAQKCRLLTEEPFNTWTQVKFQQCQNGLRGLIAFWIILVSFCLIQFIYYSYYDGHTHIGLAVILLSLALFGLLVEMMYVKTNYKEMVCFMKNIFSNKRVPVTFTAGYRSFQIVFCILIIISAVVTFYQDLRCIYEEFVIILWTLTIFSSFFSLLFFLQLSSTVGHLLISMQKMLFTTLTFFFMLGFIYVAFTLSFFILHNSPSAPCSGKGYNSTPTCENQFSTIYSSFYVTFLFFLTAVAPIDIGFPCSKIPTLTRIFYVMLLVVFALVLVNMLIAVMTKVMDGLSDIQDDILKLEQMSIVLYVEERIKTNVLQLIIRFFTYLRKKLTCCSSCSRCTNVSVCERCIHVSNPPLPSPFYVDPETRKIYLEVVENILQKDVASENCD